MKCHSVLASIAISSLAISMAAVPDEQAPTPMAVDDVLVSDDETSVAGMLLSEKELDDLLAPLALYPDPLVALILPAATSPSDIVLASRYLAANPKSTTFDDQKWEDAVRGLARYPEVIKWMDENLSWTKTLGEAFAHQPVDVMNAIQRLRAKARASGALATTTQQTVTTDGEEIRITPAQSEVVYIPRYDPAVVYVDRADLFSYGPLITFGIGFPLGYWAAYDCDWRHRRVCMISRENRVRVWNECHVLGRPLHATRFDHRPSSRWIAWRGTYQAAASHGHPPFDRRSGTGSPHSTRHPSHSIASVRPGAPLSATPPVADRIPNADPAGNRRYRAPRDSTVSTRDWRQDLTQPPASGHAQRVSRDPRVPAGRDPRFSPPVSVTDPQRQEPVSTFRRHGPSENRRSMTPPSVLNDQSTRSTTDFRPRPNMPRSETTPHLIPSSRSNPRGASIPSERSAPPVRSSMPPPRTGPSFSNERPSFRASSEPSHFSPPRSSESASTRGSVEMRHSHRE